MKTNRRTSVNLLLSYGMVLAAWFTTSPAKAQALTPEEARAIAKEAYIFG